MPVNENLRPFPEIVEALREKYGAKDKRALAQQLGYTGDRERNVYRWFHGKRGSYESTIVLLEGLGLLKQNALTFLEVSPQATPEVSLDDIAEASALERRRLPARARRPRPPRQGTDG